MIKNQFDLEIPLEDQKKLDKVLQSNSIETYIENLKEFNCKFCSGNCSAGSIALPHGNLQSQVMFISSSTFESPHVYLEEKENFLAAKWFYNTYYHKAIPVKPKYYDSCKIFLFKEIDLLDPKLIIVTGHIVLPGLFGFGKKTYEKHVAGRFFNINKHPFTGRELFILTKPKAHFKSKQRETESSNTIKEELQKLTKKIKEKKWT